MFLIFVKFNLIKTVSVIESKKLKYISDAVVYSKGVRWKEKVFMVAKFTMMLGNTPDTQKTIRKQ